MVHAHESAPLHEHEAVVTRDYPGAGLMLAAAALIAVLIIGLAVFWAQPWDDDGGVNTAPVDPAITDDSGGGGDAPAPPQDGGSGSGGTDEGSSDVAPVVPE